MPKAGQPPGLAFLHPWPTVWLGLGAVAVMIGTHPLTWGWPMPALWNPAAGVGLALIAWFGFRATLIIFLAALLTTAHALLRFPHLLPANGAGGCVLRFSTLSFAHGSNLSGRLDGARDWRLTQWPTRSVGAAPGPDRWSIRKLFATFSLQKV